jgi:pilus assembly protein Flp/PilA
MRHLKTRIFLNQKGQSLIEYLLLVALMAVGTIGVLRVLNKTVQVNFANVTASLQGESRVAEHEKVETNDFKKRDMGDFMSGAAAAKSK